MFNYLKNTEVSMRIGLNPFNWVWIPSFAYESPTAFYPKRRTAALAWLFLQLYLDIDNGEADYSPLSALFTGIDVKEEND